MQLDSMKLGNILFRASLVGLAAGVAIQVGLQVEKYLAGQTTLSKSRRPDEELYLQAISFCPGFRRDKVGGLSWMMYDER